MIARRVYHVRRQGESWHVLREGFRRPHIIRNSKAEAVTMAKRLAKLGPGARVVVHAGNDEVEREFSYAPAAI
ncbi:MAG: DUF2188 domain-containing protein [Verrucomicrobiota bacterium]